MNTLKKEYEFDKKLVSDNIKFIDRNEFNHFVAQVRCNRCNALLKRFVVTIRIDDEYYQIGNDCYDSVKVRLSEIRGKSLKFIREDLEEGYEKYLHKKFSPAELELTARKGAYKYDTDWNVYKELDWDHNHGGLPTHKEKEYEILKEKFRQLIALDKQL